MDGGASMVVAIRVSRLNVLLVVVAVPSDVSGMAYGSSKQECGDGAVPCRSLDLWDGSGPHSRAPVQRSHLNYPRISAIRIAWDAVPCRRKLG